MAAHTVLGLGGKLRRIPLWSLLALILCSIGSILFVITGYESSRLIRFVHQDIFHSYESWFHEVTLGVIFFGLSTCLYAWFLLFVDFASDDIIWETKLWAKWLGGRVSIGIFFTLTYLLFMVWTVLFIFLIILTFSYTHFQILCDENESSSMEEAKLCIDTATMPLFYYYSPSSAHLKICFPDTGVFCHSYVQPTAFPLKLTTIGALIVVLSLVHFLICLAANWSRNHFRKKYEYIEYKDSETETLSNDHEGFLRVLNYSPPPPIINGKVLK
uniref:Uncharacterized protein n=1 Tax=Strigamia maritima TaxID=126957 RepID=T1J3Y9_STRMM